jgi:acyl carrier protein
VDITQEVIDIIGDTLLTDTDGVGAGTNLEDIVEGFDEADLLEVVMAIEEEFCVSIEEDEVKGFVTVGDVVACLSKHGIEEGD